MRIRTAPLLAGLCLCLSLTAWAWDAARIQQQASALSAATQQLTRQLLQLVEAQQGQPVMQQLEQVNRFFNQRVAWRDDQSVWGQVDYWAAPLEMFGKGAGDCEDLAMGKYFSLLGLGVAEASLRLVYVRAQWEGRPQAHMVLAWYATPDAEPYILYHLSPLNLNRRYPPDQARKLLQLLLVSQVMFQSLKRKLLKRKVCLKLPVLALRL
jgi:predicted transglutaminase-like cysteine proteinase